MLYKIGGIDMQKIVPHLWFDKEAVEAAEFYTSLFDDSKIDSIVQLHDTPSGDSDTVSLKLYGQDFMFISAGPIFQLNPSISLMVNSPTKEEVNHLWETLSVDGTILMDLGEYPFSERYGWLNDRYGVSWQLIYVDQPFKQKIVPNMMYAGQQAGKAKEAIEFYTSLFEDSKVESVSYYDAKENPAQDGMLQYASFTLAGEGFSAMDSVEAHAFKFNEAFSILVNCDTQEEIDFLWDKLSVVPEAEQCGWLRDRFGVSWQISPSVLEDLMATKDEEQKQRVTDAFLQMKKMDIAELKRAYDGQ